MKLVDIHPSDVCSVRGARRDGTNSPVLLAGRACVDSIERGEHGWQLSTDPTTPVRIAVSCLIEPMPGDRVLVSAIGGVWYVIAVLERDGRENKLTIDLGGAEFHLKAESMHFEAEQTCELKAENLRMHSQLLIQNATTQVANVSGVSIFNVESLAIDGKSSVTISTKIGAIQASCLLKVDGTQMHFG